MAQTTQSAILKQLQEHRQDLATLYHVGRIGIFGSVARGTDTPTSDVDLLVEFTQPIGLLLFVELEFYLEQLLGRKVDLVTPKALKSRIRAGILADVRYV